MSNVTDDKQTAHLLTIAERGLVVWKLKGTAPEIIQKLKGWFRVKSDGIYYNDRQSAIVGFHSPFQENSFVPIDQPCKEQYCENGETLISCAVDGCVNLTNPICTDCSNERFIHDGPCETCHGDGQHRVKVGPVELRQANDILAPMRDDEWGPVLDAMEKHFGKTPDWLCVSKPIEGTKEKEP